MSTWRAARASRATAGVVRLRRAGIYRFAAIAVALSLVVTVSVAIAPQETASAKVSYPSWNDVQKARKSEARTKKEIKRIQQLVWDLSHQVDETQAEAVKKGEQYQLADQEYQEAALRADELQGQADAATKIAKRSVERAGEMAGRLYRSGNSDFSLNLLVNASEADDLLYSYGMANKFSEQAAGVYDSATQDKNTAQALTDQADIARNLLEDLKVKAEKALNEASEAADKAADAYAEQQANQNKLNAQLAVLTQRRKATEKDYAKGIARQNPGGVNLAGGQISSSGWAKPAGGRITSGFGYRVDPNTGGSSFHLGTDLGNPCGTTIYAAHAGTVSYSGINGVYGNFIRLNHGDGVQTEYGHIMNGGLLVRNGATISVGQPIAKVGATGIATGCHLHFGVRINGVVTDPVPFMKARGITLG